MILPALLLTLDKCSSWRVGRVVPMIRSAVRTTLYSLLRSDLVAELNQTDPQLLCSSNHSWFVYETSSNILAIVSVSLSNPCI